VNENQATHTVTKMCDVLEVSRSGFYEWRNREPSQRQRDDDMLTETMTEAWRASRCSYGLPRLMPEVCERLAAAGSTVKLGNRRARRLMARHGIVGQSRRRWRQGCTKRDPRARPAPDLLNRDFTASGPNRRWVTDITQVDTLAGACWAAVVTDVWSRRIVGWAIADHHRAELVIDALTMAVLARRPPAGLIVHSDQGSEFTSWDMQRFCSAHHIRQSMGSVGDCFDNAMAESVFATIETELLWQHTFINLHDAQSHFIDFIEGWYNTNRRHTSIGNISPIKFESIHMNSYATPQR
jgi:putative transposase